jgi:hypothetical protein
MQQARATRCAGSSTSAFARSIASSTPALISAEISRTSASRSAKWL